MQHSPTTAAVIDGEGSQDNLKGLQKAYKNLLLIKKILIKAKQTELC